LTVKLVDEDNVELSGSCPPEDAEVLFQHLLENRSATVDWTKCEQAHTAVIQVLLASGCELKGPPAASFLKEYVEAALRRARDRNSTFPGPRRGAK
jgi:hypothetical protein